MTGRTALVTGAASGIGYGSSDATVMPLNADHLRDQWTNVWHIGQTPSASTSLPANTTRDDYRSGGTAVVQVYRVAGIGHGAPVDPGSAADQCGTAAAFFLDSICSAYHIGRGWGLDGAAPPPPPGSLPTPAGLVVTGTTDTTVSLAWNVVSGAASYRVFRDGGPGRHADRHHVCRQWTVGQHDIQLSGRRRRLGRQ